MDPGTPSGTATGNHLVGQKSPYLLRHAQNPVDWYPWGKAAFEKARSEDRPIFLSIGYSSCHWCNVMAEESFSDPEVASLMNRTFVSVKVDREERPDIDNLYMTICQMMTGAGGWPLTVILTPDRKPIFAATYIPRETRLGMSGMLDLIPRIDELWRTRRKELEREGERAMSLLNRSLGARSGPADLSAEPAYEHLLGAFDDIHGGFGGAPKFPSPHNLLFLLWYWKMKKDGAALAMVEKTLRSMRLGGVFDQLGHGFHRYSTDSRWTVPHFEKMLYDQAMLAMAYTEAYQATGKEEYAATARQTLDYALSELRSPEGGFFSSEDADSEGEEGKFYLWSEEDVRAALPADEAELALKVLFGRERAAPHRDGPLSRSYVMHLGGDLAVMSRETGIPGAELAARLEGIRTKLLSERAKRPRPLKDDKILADWNGLMAAALAKAGRAFGEARYVEAAASAMGFILGRMRDGEGRLLHRYRDGEAAIQGFLEDYSHTMWGLLELYEATFDAEYVRRAIELDSVLVGHFWDDGGFAQCADDFRDGVKRIKDPLDGATPSGNSVALLNTLRLARITGRTELEERLQKLQECFAARVSSAPYAHAFFLIGVGASRNPFHEVVVSGDRRSAGVKEMLLALSRPYLPDAVVLLRDTSASDPPIDSVSSYTAHCPPRPPGAVVYVCKDYSCDLPVTDVGAVLKAIGSA
ncbi:MAG: thioredoxin domain-containing protein [Nitrososphaerota archaeon]|nr:thioredoxin domain-containing protein [Nitrososphaerota archaeon]MDG6938804.1 thioredoxin domain-containing protein [Nitrososphaerota archaeon]